MDYVEECSYEQFLQRYLKPNRPVILGPKLTANWIARRKWVKRSNENRTDRETGLQLSTETASTPNYEYLNEQYGSLAVPTAFCDQKDKYGSQLRKTLPFEHSLLQFKKDGGRSTLVYPKDMHLFRDRPSVKAYETPELFMDDWLNLYVMEVEGDDFRFVYMGADRSTTPLHTDVYQSYSFSVNICGTKRWLFISPEDVLVIAARYGSPEMPSWIRYDDFQPGGLLYDLRSKILDTLQREGETVFVPSGWYHQVENIGVTLSINHNWCNASCIEYMHNALHAEYARTRESLQDLLDDGITSRERFSEVVDEVVAANYGWTWKKFWAMIEHYLRRIRLHEPRKKTTDTPMWNIPPQFIPPWSYDASALNRIFERDGNKVPSSVLSTFQQCENKVCQ